MDKIVYSYMVKTKKTLKRRRLILYQHLNLVCFLPSVYMVTYALYSFVSRYSNKEPLANLPYLPTSPANTRTYPTK